MKKIVVLVPTPALMPVVEGIQARGEFEFSIVQTRSQTILEAVRQAREAGALVAVARGRQARIVAENTDIPLAEIKLSGQEIAALIDKARRLVGKANPAIAFASYRNTYSDTEALEGPMGVRIINELFDQLSQMPDCVRRAKERGADILIGGTIETEEARRIGLETLLVESSEESILAALKRAQDLLLAIEIERKKADEIALLLNYSMDGILRVDGDGRIQMANYMAEKIFRMRSDKLRGRPIEDFIEPSESDPVRMALEDGKNTYATILYHGNTALVANVAAVAGPSGSEGAILTFQEFQSIDELEMSVRQERYQRGYVAKHRFSQMKSQVPAMNDALKTAAIYARYDLPVLLTGPLGTGKRTMAECVHNASMRKKNPFVSIDCMGMPPDIQASVLFGEGDRKGLLEIAHMGSVYIDHIARMDSYCQYQLLQIDHDKLLLKDQGRRAVPVDVRVIAGTDENLERAVRERDFNENLYCMLSQLEIRLPTLRERVADLPGIIGEFMERYAAHYRKYAVLSEGARALICNHDWPGNLLQLELFIEKLVILAEDKWIDEDFVRDKLPAGGQTQAEAEAAPQSAPDRVYASEEADRILRALMEHGGSRRAAAEALGMSKSTLWRKMKQYNIEQSFHKE